MHIVSVYNLPVGKESLAGALCAALGCTAYEALSRLRFPGSGPFIVAVCAAAEPAEELTKKLKAAGFDTILLKKEEIGPEATRFVVRKFRFGEDALVVASRSEEDLAIGYGSVDLLIRGTSIEQTTKRETIKEKKFNTGTALITGGLKMSKTTEQVSESTEQTRNGFLLLYAGEQPTLLFREDALVYNSLGTELQPTRQANFSHLIEELRRRCPDALYDDRLSTRKSQVQILGPVLCPEEHLDIAISLLAKFLRP